MVLGFTGSIEVGLHGEVEARTVLAGAIGCNLAWGIVDAAMYLMANFSERARGAAVIRAIQRAPASDVAQQLVRDAMPPIVSKVLTSSEVEAVIRRLNEMPDPTPFVSLTREDFKAAAGVFLLVFLSTLPVAIPFFVMADVPMAMRASNAIALTMLFITGWSVGKYAGHRPVRTGLAMVAIGVVLVSITMALGG